MEGNALYKRECLNALLEGEKGKSKCTCKRNTKSKRPMLSRSSQNAVTWRDSLTSRLPSQVGAYSKFEPLLYFYTSFLRSACTLQTQPRYAVHPLLCLHRTRTHVMSKKQQARRAALEQEITELQKVLGLVSLLLLLKYMTVFSSLNT